MSAIFLVLGVLFVLSLIPLGVVLARAYARARGPRAILCPETKSPEIVEVNARRAAWAGARSETDYTLVSCSRWPERQDCGQQCLTQIESAPDGCLVRERLVKWYGDALCALCHRPIGEIRWLDHKPGLLSPDRKALAWEEIRAEELPEILGTHSPLCWNCQTTETFRARFPERVLDSPRPFGQRPPS